MLLKINKPFFIQKNIGAIIHDSGNQRQLAGLNIFRSTPYSLLVVVEGPLTIHRWSFDELFLCPTGLLVTTFMSVWSYLVHAQSIPWLVLRSSTIKSSSINHANMLYSYVPPTMHAYKHCRRGQAALEWSHNGHRRSMATITRLAHFDLTVGMHGLWTT